MRQSAGACSSTQLSDTTHPRLFGEWSRGAIIDPGASSRCAWRYVQAFSAQFHHHHQNTRYTPATPGEQASGGRNPSRREVFLATRCAARPGTRYAPCANPIGSCRRKRNRHRGSVAGFFDLIGENSQGNSFCFRHGFFLRGAVCHDAWKLNDIRYPATIFLPIDLKCKRDYIGAQRISPPL